MKHKVPTEARRLPSFKRGGCLFRDDDTLANTGFVGCGAPETCWGRSNTFSRDPFTA